MTFQKISHDDENKAGTDRVLQLSTWDGESLSQKWGKLLLESYSAHTYLLLATVNSFDLTTDPETWQSTSNPLYFHLQNTTLS